MSYTYGKVQIYTLFDETNMHYPHNLMRVHCIAYPKWLAFINCTLYKCHVKDRYLDKSIFICPVIKVMWLQVTGPSDFEASLWKHYV